MAEIRAYISGSPSARGSPNARAVAFDFETAPNPPYRNDNKSAFDSAKARIVGCSFSAEEGTGIYVPVDHVSGENINKVEFFSFLREFLSDTTIVKIAHNLVFESAFAYAMGIVIQPPVYDTLAAAQMTLSGAYTFRKLNQSGLKTLAKELFEELPTFDTVTAGRHFDELDVNESETVRYGAADSDFALRLYHMFNSWFDKTMPKHRFIVENLESPTSVYLGIMKCNGIPVNAQLMAEKKAEAEAEMARIRKKIGVFAGDVDIGRDCNTRAFKNFLYKDLKLPILKTTESGCASADDEAMIRLAEWSNTNRPELAELFTLVQTYRNWSKVVATYIDGYTKNINCVTGRIHPDLFSLSTDTGRMNCRNPNVQNMPRKDNDPVGVRNFVQAPPGHSLLSLDYSQIELRVGAVFCRDKTMLETYRRDGDIHAATTAVIYGISYEEAKDESAEHYKERRTIAKNVNFGTFYGLYPKGLQRTLKFKAGIEKSLEECDEIIRNIKTGYKGLSTWQTETKAVAARRLYTESWLGRRRYLPDITSSDWSKRTFAERCALNTPIQGTAADILKLSIARILTGLPERPWLQPMLPIHDELTFIIPEDKLSEAVDFVRGCMEAKPFPEFDIPLIAEASAGPSFGKMQELSGR